MQVMMKMHKKEILGNNKYHKIFLEAAPQPIAVELLFFLDQALVLSCDLSMSMPQSIIYGVIPLHTNKQSDEQRNSTIQKKINILHQALAIKMPPYMQSAHFFGSVPHLKFT